MNGDEKICIHLVGNGSTLLQGNKYISGTSHDNIKTKFTLQLLGKLQCNAQCHILFHGSRGTKSSGILTTMPWVNHDPANLCKRNRSWNSYSRFTFHLRLHRLFKGR